MLRHAFFLEQRHLLRHFLQRGWRGFQADFFQHGLIIKKQLHIHQKRDAPRLFLIFERFQQGGREVFAHGGGQVVV